MKFRQGEIGGWRGRGRGRECGCLGTEKRPAGSEIF